MATVTSTHRHTQESLTCTQISLLVAGTKVEIAIYTMLGHGGREGTSHSGLQVKTILLTTCSTCVG